MLSNESRLRDFPSLADRAYLNTAAEGILPTTVLDALSQYGRDKNLGMDGRIPHGEQFDACKALIGEFYGLSADEIGICSCSSEAYNLAAMALRLQPGDEVIINDLDFPAGATPWLQDGCPASVKIWRQRDGGLRVEDLVALLTPKTRLVTVSLVSFFNGFMVNVPEIVAAVRKHSNSLLAVDVTQAMGRVSMDLNGVDLVVSSTHKWILSTHGGGLVGVPKARAKEWTVPAGGWFHLEDAFGPKRFEKAISKPGAASFAVGMPNYPAIYATRAALEYVRGVGVEAINRTVRPVVLACLEELRKLPIEMLTPNEPEHIAGILAFRHPDADRIHKHLHSQNVHVMSSAGRMRIAIHGYNTMGDVERLLAALRSAI